MGDAPTKLGNLKTKEAEAVSNLTPAQIIETTRTQLGEEFIDTLKSILRSHVEVLEEPKDVPPARKRFRRYALHEVNRWGNST